MALHPEEMDAAILRNLEAKTGRSLAEWLDLLAGAPAMEKASQRLAWLKAQGLGHVTAQVVLRQAGGVASVPGAFRDALFPPGTALRDRFDGAEAALCAAFPGTVVTDCKGYVGFGDPVQFAVLTARRGGLVGGLARIAPDLPAPETAQGLGGGRIGWKMVLEGPADIARMIAHLRGG